MHTQLKNVQQLQTSSRAYAAVLSDGFVASWDDASFGGESSPALQEQLRNVG